MSNQNYGELREVKRGQVGTGLLIEHDGHILTESDTIKQIREDIENGHKYVCPERIILDGVFQKYDVLNANGRIYPKNVLVPAVDKYIKDRVNLHCAVGSLNHPSDSTLSGHDVSHNIIELHWEGHTLVGKLELHLTPGYIRYGIMSSSGDKVANMVINGILIGVSSRALGSVEQMPGGKLVVGDDLEILCWDSVLEPSTPGAWLKTSRAELQPFIENEKKEGHPLDEQLETIKALLDAKF